MQRTSVAVLLAVGSVIFLSAPRPASADQSGLGQDERWWLEGGIGGASVDTRAPGLPGRHGAAILTAALGYRATRGVSIGLEYATSASLSGCQRWNCRGRSWDFMPAFNRASLFGEMRFFDGSMSLRYGAGDLSYCYAGGAGPNLWYLAYVALADDGYARLDCRAVHGLVKSASIGYHWRMPGGDSSPSMGSLRLGVEDAYMHGRQAAGLPPFHYRAVTLTFQLGFN